MNRRKLLAALGAAPVAVIPAFAQDAQNARYRVFEDTNDDKTRTRYYVASFKRTDDGMSDIPVDIIYQTDWTDRIWPFAKRPGEDHMFFARAVGVERALNAGLVVPASTLNAA